MLEKFLLMFALLASANGFAAEGSCLVKTLQSSEVSGAHIEPADAKLSVIRPCGGKVRTGPVEVIFSTGDGYSQRALVPSGEYIDKAVGAVAGAGKPLVEIWPTGGMLSAMVAFLQGKRGGQSGTSGFETGNEIAISGEVLPLPNTRIFLKLHGWDPNAPVQFAQAGWNASVAPQDGVLPVPVKRLVAGPLRLTQGSRTAAVNVVAFSEVQDVLEKLKAINAQSGDSSLLATQRALLLQENQFQLNALSAFFGER